MASRKIVRRIGYWIFLLLFTLVAAEIILRIYNPFPTSVTGDRVTLQTNTRVTFRNAKETLLDSTVIVLKNSLGFRGVDPPKNLPDYLSILTIGGSTTECIFINEEKTWPALLSDTLNQSFSPFWLNNAGLNGHSTFGHIKLLKDYVVPIKPKVCIFLVGCNDIDRPDLNRYDQSMVNSNQYLVVRLARYSRLVNVGLNFYRHHLAKERELIQEHPYGLRKQLPVLISDSAIQQTLDKLKPDVVNYSGRLKTIISICKQANILPIFLTQPCLLGEGIDDVTRIDLATYPFRNINGRLQWLELEMYNDETRRVCNENNVMVIDLAHLLPKSTKYFYDAFHYNNNGCKKINELIAIPVLNYLTNKFPSFRRK